MVVPEEFKRLAQGFYQGSRERFATSEEWIASAINRLDSKQKAVAKRFITDFLRMTPSAADVQRVWESTVADYHFGRDEHEMRGFLAMIRDAL